MTIRILSLDDEPEMGDLIRLILGRVGYELVFSTNNHEAWDLLHVEQFDLVMQDLMRPDMDGWEFYRMLKSDPALYDLPVMIVTAVARHLGQGTGPLGVAGVDSYVVKPFGPSELTAAVEFVVRKYGKTPLARVEPIPQPNDQQDPATLIGALESEDRETRISAVRALGRLQDRQAVEPLIAMLKTKHDKDALLAAQALGQIGDPRAVRPLLQVLHKEIARVDALSRQVSTRTGCALLKAGFGLLKIMFSILLARIGYRRALDWMATTTRYSFNTPWEVRKALVQIGRPAVEPLTESARAVYPQERKAAIEILGQIRDERSVDPLIAALQDEDASVRCTAAWYLGNAGGERVIGPLIAALDDKDILTRCAAVRSLAFLKRSEAVTPLIAMLQNQDADVVWKVAGALGQIGDSRAIPHLEQLVKEDARTTRYDGTVATIAQRAVERIEAAR